jgi:hypothetical protein
MGFWRYLMTPDDFARDWYGELRNQLSHTLLGVLAAATFCDVWALTTGEMPVKAWAFLAVFLPYAVGVEWAVQRWLPGDSWFDATMFGLGAAGALLPYSEAGSASPVFTLDYSPAYRLSIMAFWALLLALRVKKRIDANRRHVDTK